MSICTDNPIKNAMNPYSFGWIGEIDEIGVRWHASGYTSSSAN